MAVSDPHAPPRIDAQHALILDFDGTLVALQDNPDSVWLDDGVDALLLSMRDRLGGALAVLSGRDVRDLARRVPDALWRLGGHGTTVCAPGVVPPQQIDSGPASLHAALEALAGRYEGVRCEHKGPVIALHTRANPDVQDVLENEVRAVIRDVADYGVQSGKCVIEAKPAAANKGRALASLLERAPFAGRTALMLGDDATDEDAFREVQSRGGFGVKVGPGDSVARYRLDSPDATIAWLRDNLR